MVCVGETLNSVLLKCLFLRDTPSCCLGERKPGEWRQEEKPCLRSARLCSSSGSGRVFLSMNCQHPSFLSSAHPPPLQTKAHPVPITENCYPLSDGQPKTSSSSSPAWLPHLPGSPAHPGECRSSCRVTPVVRSSLTRRTSSHYVTQTGLELFQTSSLPEQHDIHLRSLGSAWELRGSQYTMRSTPCAILIGLSEAQPCTAMALVPRTETSYIRTER